MTEQDKNSKTNNKDFKDSLTEASRALRDDNSSRKEKVKRRQRGAIKVFKSTIVIIKIARKNLINKYQLFIK